MDKRISPRRVRKSLPKGKVKKLLPKADDELEISAPKKLQKLLPAPRKFLNLPKFLRGTKHYVLEYVLSLKLVIAIMAVTYVSAFYLVDRITAQGAPPSRSVLFMNFSLILAVVGLVLLPMLLMRTVAAEQKEPELIKSSIRNKSFEVAFWFAVLGAIGFGLATLYLLGSSVFSLKGWSYYGVYAACTTLLAGLHACLIFALPRRSDEDNTRSMLEMAVVVPCVIIIAFAYGYNRGPAKIVEQDKTTLKDLIILRDVIDKKYNETKKLPGSIDDLIAQQPPELQANAKTKNYKYVAASNRAQKILGNISVSALTGKASDVKAYYFLCASFATDVRSSEIPVDTAPLPQQFEYASNKSINKNSPHRRGEQCYLVVLK